MRTLAILSMAALSLGGCAARYALLTVPAISMTQPSFEPTHKGAQGSRIEATYCQGEAPISSHDNNVGLIDEVVLKAQKQSGASYLSDVTIFRDGQCVVVDAIAMK